MLRLHERAAVALVAAHQPVGVAFIPAPQGGLHAITPHPCRSTDGLPTWRDQHRATEPNPEYLAAKAALTNDSAKETT